MKRKHDIISQNGFFDWIPKEVFIMLLDFIKDNDNDRECIYSKERQWSSLYAFFNCSKSLQQKYGHEFAKRLILCTNSIMSIQRHYELFGFKSFFHYDKLKYINVSREIEMPYDNHKTHCVFLSKLNIECDLIIGPLDVVELFPLAKKVIITDRHTEDHVIEKLEEHQSVDVQIKQCSYQTVHERKRLWKSNCKKLILRFCRGSEYELLVYDFSFLPKDLIDLTLDFSMSNNTRYRFVFPPDRQLQIESLTILNPNSFMNYTFPKLNDEFFKNLPNLTQLNYNSCSLKTSAMKCTALNIKRSINPYYINNKIITHLTASAIPLYTIEFPELVYLNIFSVNLRISETQNVNQSLFPKLRVLQYTSQIEEGTALPLAFRKCGKLEKLKVNFTNCSVQQNFTVGIPKLFFETIPSSCKQLKLDLHNTSNYHVLNIMYIPANIVTLEIHSADLQGDTKNMTIKNLIICNMIKSETMLSLFANMEHLTLLIKNITNIQQIQHLPQFVKRITIIHSDIKNIGEAKIREFATRNNIIVEILNHSKKIKFY